MNLTNIRWAWRSLSRSKGFFATAVATLGLALGLCTTTFAILDGITHPWTPVVHPESVLEIDPNGVVRDARASAYERFQLIRSTTHFASGWSFVVSQFRVVHVGDRDYNLFFQLATPNHLALLGIKPTMGRWFDSTAEPRNAVVVSEAVWREFFPKATGLEGATINADGRDWPVVGVVPYATAAVFQALPADRPPVPATSWGSIYARLKPGVTRDDAHRELSVVARQLNQQFDPVNHTFSFSLRDLTPRALGGQGFGALFLIVGLLVLVLACTNLAGMMTARGTARRREIALRLALGATRRAIVRQLLAEALLIAGVGCAVGVLVAIWGVYIVLHEVPRRLWYAGQLEMHLSWRVFAFAVLAAVTVGVVVGVFPGLRASQVNLDEPLKESSAGTTGRRRGKYSWLTITQLAMAMTLLMGTGLLVRSAHMVSSYDFGFDTRHLVVAQFFLMRRDTTRKESTSLPRLLEVASQVPGVKGVAVLSGLAAFPQAVFPDKPLPDRRASIPADVASASTGFNNVLDLPLIAGRGFEPGDLGAPVAIVDQSAARQLFLGADPIGHLIKLGSLRGRQGWSRIVGVVADAELGFRGDPDMTHTPVVYLSPDSGAASSARILARVSGNDATVASALAREVQTAFGLVRVPASGTFTAMAGQESYQATLGFVDPMFSEFGAFALGLAGVGLYAVVAYAAAQRMREFAVRAALGADRTHLIKLAVHDGAVMTLGGIGLGAFVAMAATYKMWGLLYGLYPIDVISLVGAELALCSVAFLACLGPARRAMKADPAEILRAV